MTDLRLRVYPKTCAIFILLMTITQSAPASEAEVDVLFDFGVPGSPIAAGATPVYPDHIYGEEGYGWLDASPKGFNHETTGLSEKGNEHHPLHLISPGWELYRAFSFRFAESRKGLKSDMVSVIDVDNLT